MRIIICGLQHWPDRLAELFLELYLNVQMLCLGICDDICDNLVYLLL